MNEMAHGQNIVCPVASQHSKMKRLSELEAFIVLDDTLDALNKQYLDAKAQRKELVALSGADDAMAVVAMDMEDSTWCAMQARYIELRANRKMMARAQKMMRQRDLQIEELEERILQSDKVKQAQNFANYLKILEIVKEKNKTPRIFEWMALFLFLRINIFGQDMNKKYTQNFAVAA